MSQKKESEEKAIAKLALLVRSNPIQVSEFLLSHGEPPSKSAYENFIKLLALSDEIGKGFDEGMAKCFSGFKIKPTNGSKAVYNLTEGEETMESDSIKSALDTAKKLLITEDGKPTELSKKAQESLQKLLGKKKKEEESKSTPSSQQKPVTKKKVVEDKDDEEKEETILGMSKTVAYVVFAIIVVILIIIALRFLKKQPVK